jgi:hypothetical protein
MFNAGVSSASPDLDGARTTLTLLNVAQLGVILLLFGFVSLNYQFDTGNGESQCDCYTTQWWVSVLLTVNVLVPYTGMLALVHLRSDYLKTLSLWVTTLAFLLDIGLLLFLLRDWLLCCNTLQGAGSMCNDPRWCCVFADELDADSTLCPVAGPCVPGVSEDELSVNANFTVSFLATAALTALTFVHITLIASLRRYTEEFKRQYEPSVYRVKSLGYGSVFGE